MKKYILVIVAFLIVLVYLNAISNRAIRCNSNTNTVYVEYFKKYDTLLPDYACPDTLIVIDNIGLNKAVAKVEQSKDIDFGTDADYNELFNKYCKILNK